MKNWECITLDKNTTRWYAAVIDKFNERIDLAYLPEKKFVRFDQVSTVLLDEQGVDKLIKRLQSVQREMRKHG